MSKWIELNDRVTGAKLKVAQIDGSTFLFIVGMSNKSSRWQAAVDKLGFTSGGNGRFLIKPVRPGERTSAKQFHAVWPNAAFTDMEPGQYLLDLSRGKKQRQEATDEERKLANETAGATRLGRNADGDEIYEGPLGRFIWREQYGATRESPNLLPAMLLRAPDDEALDRCADGYVKSMVLGEVQHSEDFDRFVQAVSGLSPAAAGAEMVKWRDRAHAAIDAAVVRHLSLEFDTAQDAYGESVRLYEYLPPYQGSARGKGAMPSPLSIIAQRLLGDTSGKLVSVPNAFDGASFSFLPAETRVRAFRGIKDLSKRAAGLARSEKAAANVEWVDEFVPAREQGADAVFFNADPVRTGDGSRADYRDGLLAVRTLAEGGRAVLVLAADDLPAAGALSAESSRFLETLAARGVIEEAFELSAALSQRVGGRTPLRVIVVRNGAAEEGLQQQARQSLPVAHSWDEVKARVDEALVQAKVREAESQGIDVERAARVNKFQSPYIAFSKVSESRTMVPKNLQAPLQAALSDLESVNGPIDRFVESALGFGENTLGERFSAEQVDALGLIIARMGRGRAAILADETGIGKGRTLGGIATWASKQGRPVVFITDRANLFSDLARDLRDIGEWGRFRPLITNADGRIVDTIGDSGVLAEGTKPELMHQILENDTPLADLDGNIIFATYSQIAGEDSPKAVWIKNQLPEALLIVDEAHIAAGSDSTISRQISEMAAMSWNVVFSSATWAKSAKNLHIYARAFPETVNIGSLTETMKRGGDGFAEVFSSMLARDGALVRREHDLSRLEFVLEVDAANLERNRRIADKVAEVMGSISYTAGNLSKLMFRMSQESLDALREARDARSNGATANIFATAFGAGSMLYQVQRRMNAALNVDNAVRLALKALEEGRKPVIVFDDTGESFVRRALRDQAQQAESNPDVAADVIRVPTIRDLLLKVLEDVETVKVRDVSAEELADADEAGVNLAAVAVTEDEGVDATALAEGHPAAPNGAAPGAPDADDDVAPAPSAPRRAARKPKKAVRRVPFAELPDVPEAQRTAYREGMAELRRLIDEVEPLPLSVADEIHRLLQAAGVRTGEISGRGFMLQRVEAAAAEGPEQGSTPAADQTVWARVLKRPKSKAFVNAAVRAFNSGDVDCELLNRAAATGISLHASPRFADQRRRELIEMQSAENPSDRVQLFGRVNRFDQLSFPRISIPSTGVPGEVRQLMMQNKKLEEMSANVRSSRETHAVVKDVIDLLNPIGREVCQQFFLDNPQYATRMGLSIKRIEDGEIDAANAFSQRVALLRVSEQEHLYELVHALYDEAVLKAELAGENPLKAKEMDIRARSVSKRVVFGLDHGGLGSAFDGPVYGEELVFEVTLKPMVWGAITERIAEARRRLVKDGQAVQVATMLDGHRTPIIQIDDLAAKTTLQLEALARTALVATTFANTAEALSSSGPNPVKRGMLRKDWVQHNLPRLVPGARINMPHPSKHPHFAGASVPGVVVDLIPPPAKKESQLAHWKVVVVQAGDEQPVSHSLNALLEGVSYAPLADGETSPEPIGPVVISEDLVWHAGELRNRPLVGAFENAPSGKRTRRAAMLTGNMYLASEFAAQSRAGQGVIFSDDRGIRHRGVLLHRQFNAHSLRHMPVRVWIPRAIERLMLRLTELDQPEGVRTDGQPAQEQVRRNFRGGYLMHTSFQGAWSYAANASTGLDTILLVPGEGIAIAPGKDSGKRIANQLRAAQKRIREEEAKAAAQAGEADSQASAEQVLVAAVAQAQDAAAAASEGAEPGADHAPAAAGATGRRRGQGRRARAAAADPNAVVVSQARQTRGVAPIVLKATTAGQLRRAVHMLLDGPGLQLFVSPHTELGECARKIVQNDLLERLRAQIGDDPVRLAKLEEQVLRMNTQEAAQETALGLEALTGDQDAEPQQQLELAQQLPAGDGQDVQDDAGGPFEDGAPDQEATSGQPEHDDPDSDEAADDEGLRDRMVA